MSNEIDNKLKKIIIGISRKNESSESITSDTNLIEDFGFDSVKIVEMITEIEDIFNVIFEDEDMDVDILTHYDKLYGCIKNKISETG